VGPLGRRIVGDRSGERLLDLVDPPQLLSLPQVQEHPAAPAPDRPPAAHLGHAQAQDLAPHLTDQPGAGLL